MNDNDDLKYSTEALATRYYFYKELNEINIFVEDEGQEYQYEKIFQRLLQNKFKIETIFSAGGKTNLKKRFDEFGECDRDTKIKNVYIADGDFDLFLFKNNCIDHPNFIYLETYNIENYFIDKDACINFTQGRLRMLEKDTLQKVNFENWQSKIVEQASTLFFCYCFIKKYHPHVSNVGRGPYFFIDNKSGFEKEGLWENFHEELMGLDCTYKSKIEEIIESYEKINGKNYFNLICGKFLFTSLCVYIRKITNIKFNKDDFKWHLICNFDIHKLDYVKEKIRFICS